MAIDDERGTMKKHITVVGAVIVRDGLIYCARRGLGGALPGMWEFPGGKVEKDESFAEALIREIDEELGCEISVLEPLETTTHEYVFAVITLATFLCELVAGEPQSNEHVEERWLPVEALDTLEWAPADIPAVEKLRAAGV
ncbi:(deoxy)nucleoside triphosphate pyrophosphohydrolase [Microcella sp.]|uniref:(deoxy)nucleoside triphosphate pyrophosphohydrolase n=1 Tax=Microcella sp. TaxID=1913979 RepID=UPI00391AFBE8